MNGRVTADRHQHHPPTALARAQEIVGRLHEDGCTGQQAMLILAMALGFQAEIEARQDHTRIEPLILAVAKVARHAVELAQAARVGPIF